MKITKYEKLMLRFEKLAKDKEKNADELADLSIKLASQKEKLQKLSVEKVKERLKSKNISYAEYCNLKDLLKEKKVYEKKASLIDEVISGNYDNVHQKRRVVFRRAGKSALAVGLAALMAFGAVSCLNKKSNKDLNNNPTSDEADNSVDEDTKDSNIDKNKDKDKDNNKNNDTTEEANNIDEEEDKKDEVDKDKKDESDKKDTPGSEKPEDTTVVETTDTTPEPDEPVVTEDIVPETPEDPDPNDPDPTVPDTPTPDDPVVPPITPDEPDDPNPPVPDTPEPDEPAPDEPTPDDPAPVDPSIPDPDDPPQPVDPEIPEPDTPDDVIIVIPPKPDDPLPPVPDYDIDEKDAPVTEEVEVKETFVKDTFEKEEDRDTDKEETVYISEGTAINPEIPSYFDIYVYKSNEDKIMTDEEFIDTITGTMPSLDNVDDDEVDEMVYSVSNGKKLVLTFDNNN